jgi:hypothetical protein
VHAVFTSTANAGGGFFVSQSFNPAGRDWTGYGRHSLSGHRHDTVDDDARRGATISLVNNFRLISQGPTPNLLVIQRFHLTVDAKRGGHHRSPS